MTRNLFEQQMHHLQDEILELGSTVEQSLLEVVTALRRRDVAAARKIEAHDAVINKKRFAIEEECLTLIATQQPMARDLRVLAAILEVITELERMGDYVKGIAHIITLLGPDPLPPDLLDHFDTMANQATRMLLRSLKAFLAGDAAEAKAIPLDDDEVDKLYNRIYHELVNQMIANPEFDRSRNPPALGCAQPGTLRRPGDQHLRTDALHRHRRADGNFLHGGRSRIISVLFHGSCRPSSFRSNEWECKASSRIFFVNRRGL